MNMVLNMFGVSAEDRKGYNFQFGISLNLRTAQAIVPSAGHRLMAKNQVGMSASLINNLSDSPALREVIEDFNIQSGGIDMLFINTVDVPSQSLQSILMAASTSTTVESPTELYGTIGVCYPASNVKGELSTLNPVDAAEGVFAAKNYPLYVENYAEFVEFSESMAHVEVVRQPQHGTLVKYSQEDDPVYGGLNTYKYLPGTEYIGSDKVEFLVVLGEHKVKVVYFIKAIDVEMTTYNHEEIYRKFCPKPSQWIISTVQSDPSMSPQFSDIAGFFGQVKLAFGGLSGVATGQLSSFPGYI